MMSQLSILVRYEVQSADIAYYVASNAFYPLSPGICNRIFGAVYGYSLRFGSNRRYGSVRTVFLNVGLNSRTEP